MKTLAFLLALLLAAILIPEAVSISIKTSGYDAGSCFSDSMNIDAPVDATVSGGTTISGGSSAQAISGRGTLHKRYNAISPQGDAASISVDVLMAQSYEYSQPFRTPDEARLSGFSLDASNALAISCDADAVNRDGARAKVQTDVIMGSLDGYTNSAQADENGARAVQSAGPASGALVSFSASSSNGVDLHPNANTLAAGGSLGSYSSEAYSNPQEAQSHQEFSSANGQMISAFSSALTADNLISGQTTVSQGSIASYSSSANSNTSGEAEVVQGMLGANGELIHIADTSIGQSVARVSTDVKEGNVIFLESRSYVRTMPMGAEGEYVRIPDAWHYATATGEDIWIRSTAASLLCNSDSSTSINNGTIYEYLNEAASHPYAGIAAQIAAAADGDNIHLEASSADYTTASSAHAESNILEGSLETFYSGTGANILLSETEGIQLSPGSLIAVQRASDFTGNVSLSARADIMDLNTTSGVSDPSGFRSFLQLAGTQDGYPLAFQMISSLPGGVPDPFAGFWLP